MVYVQTVLGILLAAFVALIPLFLVLYLGEFVFNWLPLGRAARFLLIILKSLRRNLLRTSLTYLASLVLVMVVTLIWSTLYFLNVLTKEKTRDLKAIVTEKYPGTIFCAVETSGDGRVNFYSRIQMFLFKAKLQAKEELEVALKETGLTFEQVQAFVRNHPRFGSPLHRPPHTVASTTADLVYQVAPYITKTWAQRRAEDAKAAVAWAKAQAEAAPGRWAKAKELARKTPGFLKQARAEWKEVSPALKEKALEELKNRFGKAFFVAADEHAEEAAAGQGSGTTSARMAAMK